MHDFPTLITLQNDALAVSVLPELGGRIIEFSDRERGRQWVWRNHRLGFAFPSQGDDYDDVWQGGFEELFPNDGPMVVGETNLPSHGELWSARWDVVDFANDRLVLETTGAATGSRVRKVFALRGLSMQVDYELELGPVPVDNFLFKLHPAFAVNEHCRIEMAGAAVEKVDVTFGNLMYGSERIAWDESGLQHIRSRESGTNEFVYLHDLNEGKVSIVDDRAKAAIDLTFSLDQFPFTWLFLTYGGWNKHNVAVVEPCTSYPKDLGEAARLGNAPTYRPGDIHHYSYQLKCRAR